MTAIKDALAMAIEHDFPRITQLLLKEALSDTETTHILLKSLSLEGPRPYTTLEKPTQSIFFAFQNKKFLDKALHLEQQQENPDTQLMHYSYKHKKSTEYEKQATSLSTHKV